MQSSRKASPARKSAPARKASPAKKSAPARKASPARKSNSAKKNSNKGGCYFTTACTDYYGLPDDCYQLKTLRVFRDNIMNKTKKDKELVKLYYEVAPTIVDKIKKSKNHRYEFKIIFKHVNEACSLIEEKKNNEAKICYANMVNFLIKKYL